MFFSENIDFIKSVISHYTIVSIICESNKLSKSLQFFAKSNTIEIYPVKEVSSLDILNADLGLIFGFGIRLRRNLINSFKYGILNFHPGCLREFRGRHPIGWALIERKDNLTLTGHLIEEDFDLGWVINTAEISIEKNDSELSLVKKVLVLIRKKFLFECVNRLINKKFMYKIYDGRYLPSLKNKYNKLNSNDFDSSFLIGLSRAKIDYGGFILNGMRVTDLFITKEIKLNKYNEFLCKDKIKVYSY